METNSPPSPTLATINALYGLQAGGRELFGYMLRVSTAINHFRNYIEGRHAQNPRSTEKNKVFFGEGNPNDAAPFYGNDIPTLLASMADDGVDLRRVGNSFFLHLYDLWEDKYRQRIADEVGLDTKSQVKSDFFGDLRSYRHGITHCGGVLKRKPEVLPFCKKDEPIHLSSGETNELFRMFVDELNRLGTVYYEVNPRFTYTRRGN